MPRRRSTTKRGHRKPTVLPPKRSLGHWNLKTFEWFLLEHCQIEDDLGPLLLEPHERAMFKDLFDGVAINLWMLPTGSRKSLLLAALALFIVTYVRSGTVFVVGGLGEQAKNCLEAAEGLIERDKRLTAWWVAQEAGLGRVKSLIPGDHAEIKLASAGRRVGGRGGATVEGKKPIAILVEELHRAEDGGSAVQTLLSKRGKRSVGGWRVPVVIVTTAGDNLKSYLGDKIAEATDVAAGATVVTGGGQYPGAPEHEYYRRGIDADGGLVLHEWAVPAGIEPPTPPMGGGEELKRWRVERDEYLRHVKLANPCSFRTIEVLRDTYMDLRSTPWIFQRQCCNQWVVQTQNALDRVGWALGKPLSECEHLTEELCDECAHRIPAGASRVVIGLDSSSKWDATAIVPAWLDPAGRVRTSGAQILLPRGKTSNVRKTLVYGVIQGMRELWPDAVLAFDENFGGGMVGDDFEDQHGMVTVNVGTGRPFVLGSMRLGEIISDRRIDHDGNEDLTEHIIRAAARMEPGAGDYWRLDKPPGGDRIDGAAALANAIHVLFTYEWPEEEAPFNPDDYRAHQL